MIEAKLFTSNKSQAIRLPKPVAFPASVERVEIIELGRSRLLTPAGSVWDTFFEGAMVSDDFMTDRAEPPMQQREDF